ncbi:pyocin knob domain-containing protein [Clostridium paraputrificum]|uniref:pyocin knob domain-containing protein n=1 Tax=Clostridium paraputrificum TaxID=29363 RepID=UPI00189A6AB8|nr:pyocin knob domain-containing protein [Clostridium paraputrificum]MDB2108937.1 pyocin knob domain-containing protein [Clostridium paraputrificum]
MALIASGIHGSGPGMSYEFYAEQTSGSGNNRTIKITLKLKAGQYSTSYYAYPVQWRANVNGSWSGWMSVKGGEAWRGSDGFRTFTYTATTNVGTTSSKSITVGIETDSIGYTHWDFSKTGSLTVSQTNVAPSLSGTVSIDGSTSNRTISENTTQLVIKTPAASDTNLSGYRFRVSVNGGGYTEIYRGSSTSYTHNISGYGEGTTFKYVVDAYDSVGAWSANIYSPTITKNKFIQDNISSTSSIAFGTTTIAFTYSGASNTQSGVTITKTLSCDNGITVYNPNITAASPINLKIWRTGEATPASTQPYVRFDDIKKVFATTTNKGKGVLNFTLTSRNSNGTTKTSSEAINVNLQVNPNNTSASISLVQTESTNYLSIASSTNKYFIPDGTKVTRVKWSSVTGKLGEAVTYQVYVAYGSGGWTKIADLPTGTTYYNHAVPVQTVSQQFKYKVRVISTYNSDNFSEATTSAQTLHYYNEPSLTQGTITRAATTADVIVTIKSNSSIPNINTKGTWAVYKSGTTTPVVSSGNLSVAQTSQTLKLTGLTDANTYDLKVTYNDDTGYMATNKVTTIKISANLPIMFINKYGVGVNGVAADSSNSLKIKGNANIAGTLNATNVQVGGNNVYHTGRKPTPADIGASPTSHNHFNCGIIDAKDLNNYTTEGLQGVTNNNCTNQPASGYFYIFNMKYNNTNIKQIAYGYNQQKMYTRHRYNGTWSGWQKVYTSDNKPTPTEIGAIPEANREIRFLGNVKSGTVIFDKTKLKNGVKVSFMTSNKMGTDSWHYAINGKWTDGWTMSQEAKYVFDFTKIKPDGSVWLYEVSVFNTYRESIGSRRCDGASKLYIGELNTLMVYLDHATNVCDNLTALIEYY